MLDKSIDLVAVLIVTSVALALALLGLQNGAVMLLLAVLLALFLPGYALIAWRAQGEFSFPIRLVLSVGLSVGLTTLAAWLLAWTPWGLQIRLWVLVLGSITVGAAAAALLRRTSVFVYASPHAPTLRHPLVVAAGSGLVLAVIGTAWTGTPEQSSAAMTLFGFPPDAGASASLVVPRDARSSAASSAVAGGPAPSAPPPAAAATPMPAAAVAPDLTEARQINIALGDWPTRQTNTASQRYTDGQYRVVLMGQPSIGVSSRLPAADYRLSVDIALEQGVAGLVFLAAEPTVLYRIMFDRERGYAIERVSTVTNQVALVADWTTSTAVQSTPLQVRIERRGDTLQFFANDQPLTIFPVPDGDVTNHVGVALADASGQGQAAFTNLVVEQLTDVR